VFAVRGALGVSAWCLGVLLLGALSCSSRPDVVAKSTADSKPEKDASIGPLPSALECRAGTYVGTMTAIPPDDGGSSFPFSGTMTFKLAQSRSGEFEVVQNTDGLTGKGNDNSHFTADIPRGRCIEGTFETDLENGEYTLPNGTTVFPFHGSITGTYNAQFLSFAGSWKTYLYLTEKPVIMGGIWTANYQP
jgi:hypothetical protein